MKNRAPRNRTLGLTENERISLPKYLLSLTSKTNTSEILNRIINQDLERVIPFLPQQFIDLMIIDPPYNITKNYNGNVFKSRQASEYIDWFEKIMVSLIPLLRPKATVYVCSDWRTSNLVFPVLNKYFYVRNRITWERKKGRGAKMNWKNNTEDIWFATLDKEYCFNIEDVKLKRKVIAPYRTDDGNPKDWEESENGNYRLTFPSNLWSDITVPFWSMPENTDHPTQKPEKLIAKLILASSNPGDFVFDPFIGSGTTAVVAKKLGRLFCGVEVDQEYCCLALKRLQQAGLDNSIQGYYDGVFWERNTLNDQKLSKKFRKESKTTKVATLETKKTPKQKTLRFFNEQQN